MDKAQTFKLGVAVAVTLLNGAPAWANNSRAIVGVESCLNFRAKPSYYSRTMECVSANTPVKFIKSADRGYSLVEINGQRGYVFNRYLGSAPKAPATEMGSVAQVIDAPATAEAKPIKVTAPPPLVQATAARIEVDVQPEKKPLIPPAAKVELPSTETTEGHIALWGNSPEKQQWTKTAVAAIREHWSKFMKARDLNDFCPRFKEASRFEKESCILNIIAGLAKFETYNFNPRDVSPEGAPLYYNSVGLFQLSHNRKAKECVKEGARSEADLKKPLLNIKCAVRIMATLVANKGSIGGRKGAGGYWAPLQYSRQHRNSKYNKIVSLAQREYNKAIARGPQPEKTVATAQVIE